MILQAALAGLTREEVSAALPEIEAFAELGDFFDRPVKTYSSGMQMRLAFSVATAVLPDVILLDEALAVGDGRFQKKCVDRIFELKASGKTIFFCSHAMYYVSTLCDRALWLNAGRVERPGQFPERRPRVREVPRAQGRASPARTAPSPPCRRERTGAFATSSSRDETASRRRSSGRDEPWAAELEFAADDPARPLQVHLGVATLDNVVCFSADSRLDGSGPFAGQSAHRVRGGVDALPLGKGEFVVDAYPRRRDPSPSSTRGATAPSTSSPTPGAAAS